MTPAQAEKTLSDDIRQPAQTNAASKGSVNGELENKSWEAWEAFMDAELLEWARSPESRTDEEEGILPPTPEAFYTVFQLALDFRNEQVAPPARAVPDGEGGICLEHGDSNAFESLHVRADGSAELLVFKNCKLTDRYQIQ